MTLPTLDEYKALQKAAEAGVCPVCNMSREEIERAGGEEWHDGYCSGRLGWEDGWTSEAIPDLISRIEAILSSHPVRDYYRGSAFYIDPLMDGKWTGCPTCKTDGPCATRLLLTKGAPK